MFICEPHSSPTGAHGKIKASPTLEDAMTNAEALKRAKRALRRALKETDHFDNGGMASHEIVDAIQKSLEAEFKAA